MVAVDGGDDGMGGYPQFTGSQGPGLLCAGVLDLESARVACASTSDQFLHRISRAAPPNDTAAGGVFYRGRIECTGDEVDITECSVGLEAVSDVTECPHGLVQQLTCTSCKQCVYTRV